MKQLWNIIGGLISLFFFGYILYAAFASGNTIIGIIIAALLIYLLSRREDKTSKETNRKILAEAAAAEERKRIQKIGRMSENEFISFVKIHRNELDEHFKNGGITRLGHGISFNRWSTSKYFIDLDIKDNEFYVALPEFLKITRRSDGAVIFSGVWGYDI